MLRMNAGLITVQDGLITISIAMTEAIYLMMIVLAMIIIVLENLQQ